MAGREPRIKALYQETIEMGPKANAALRAAELPFFVVMGLGKGNLHKFWSDVKIEERAVEDQNEYHNHLGKEFRGVGIRRDIGHKERTSRHDSQTKSEPDRFGKRGEQIRFFLRNPTILEEFEKKISVSVAAPNPKAMKRTWSTTMMDRYSTRNGRTNSSVPKTVSPKMNKQNVADNRHHVHSFCRATIWMNVRYKENKNAAVEAINKGNSSQLSV